MIPAEKYKAICEQFGHDETHPMVTRTMLMTALQDAEQEMKIEKSISNAFGKRIEEYEKERQKLEQENKELEVELKKAKCTGYDDLQIDIGHLNNENKELRERIEHKCKFFVNADWSKLNCECGKEIIPEHLKE